MTDYNNLIYLALILLMVLICYFTWRKQNRDIDNLFRETADTRTHVFFLLFDDKPQCLSIEEANRKLDAEGKIEISGFYKGFPLSVTILSRQNTESAGYSGDSVKGHVYKIQFENEHTMTIVPQEQIGEERVQDSSSNENEQNFIEKSKLTSRKNTIEDPLQKHRQRPILKGRLTVFTPKESTDEADFILADQRRMELLEHLTEHSQVDRIELEQTGLSLFDSVSDAGSRIVRVKTIFEVMAELAASIQRQNSA